MLKNRSADPGNVTEMEDTLTDGYARALELESERLRLERQISQLARQIDTPAQADQMRALAERMIAVDYELDGLRGRLGALQRHLEQTRAA